MVALSSPAMTFLRNPRAREEAIRQPKMCLVLQMGIIRTKDNVRRPHNRIARVLQFRGTHTARAICCAARRSARGQGCDVGFRG